MAQQWFLDLDGVRSGPYQTPEVLGLIAEGEVLPHHRISSSLKDQPWTTVLEWRLEQAKLTPVSDKKSYIPESKPASEPTPKRPSHEISWNDPHTPQQPPVVTPKAGEIEGVDLNPEALQDEIEEVIQVLQSNPNPVPMELKLEPAHPTTPPVMDTTLHAPHPDQPIRKRDPMAEMFDMLQNTRQKREEKAKAHPVHASPAHEKDHKVHVPQTQNNSSWVKTVVIGLLITLAGFMLGQLFQQSSTPPATVTSTEKNITAPPPAASEPEVRTEVIDRSTDKMTIRAQVEKPFGKPIPPAQAISKQSTRPTAQAQATPALDAKEMEELKDLKKELQELKALKDELRNNPAPNLEDTSEVPMDEDYLNAPGYDPNPGFNQNYPNGQQPNGRYPTDPPVNY